MKSLLCSLALLLSLCAFQADAQVQITYGSVEGASRFIDLLPNQSGQQVQFFVSGLAASADGADGFEVNAQIGDGGTILGGTDTGPVFESVDFNVGTVLDGWNQVDVVSAPLAVRSLLDDSTSVMTDGFLGTVTLDTSGFNSGTFDFMISGVAGFDTRFTELSDEVPTNAPNGFIRIQAVPEPSTAMILALGISTLVIRRRR